MKKVTVSFLAGTVLAALSSTAFAQVVPATPANRACLAGEQEVGGRCVPLTRPDSNTSGPSNNVRGGVSPGSTSGNSSGTTGSIGGGATTGTNTGGAGTAGGNNAGARQ